MAFCVNCNNQIPDMSSTCPVCGAIQQQGQYQGMQYNAQQGYGGAQGFDQGAQGYGAQQGFDQGSQGYGAQQGFDRGAQGYGTQQGFDQGSQGFGGQQGFGGPQGFDQGAQGYGAQQGFDQGFGGPQGFNQGQPGAAGPYMNNDYSGPQGFGPQGGPGAGKAVNAKKPVNKGLLIGLISAGVLVIAAVLLIFVFDVFGIMGGKPEKAAEKFMNAYTELDVQKMIDCMAPELKGDLDALGMGDSVDDVQSGFNELKRLGVEFTDVKIGEASKLDPDDAKSKVKDTTGVDIKADDAATVVCSATMHVEFMGESMDETTEFAITVVKQGSKWYVADLNEISEEDEIDPDDGEGIKPDINGDSDSNEEEKINEVAQGFMEGYRDLDVDKMLDLVAPEIRESEKFFGDGDSTYDEVKASFDLLKSMDVQMSISKATDIKKISVDDAKALVEKYSKDIEIEDAAEVTYDATMKMIDSSETSEEIVLTLIKQNGKWYIGYADENEKAQATTEAKTTEEVTEAATEATTEAATEAATEKSTEDAAVDNSTSNDDPEFEKLGCKIDMAPEKEVTFKVCGNDDESVIGSATAKLLEYSTGPVTDEQMQFGKENDIDLTGYEKKFLKFEIKFDDILNDVGFNYNIWVDDYYNTLFSDNNTERFTDTYGENYCKMKIKFNGGESYIYYWIVWNHSQEGNWYSRPEITFFIPQGYDGIVCGPSTSIGLGASPKLDEVYNQDDFHFFRLD